VREEHRPYFLKRLHIRWTEFYVDHFLRPQFEHLGKKPQIVSPRNLEINGYNISIGDYVNILNGPDNKVRITTWRGKGMNGRIKIGSYCLISPGTNITAADEIIIGDNCMFAANCYIADSDWHGIYNRIRPFRCTKSVELKDNVWVGHGAKICKGVTIGENSIVAAGAIVTKDVPANTIVAGNPAKPVKEINPDRRMLKRERMYENPDHYFENQDNLDKFFLTKNTLWNWIRVTLFPRNTD